MVAGCVSGEGSRSNNLMSTEYTRLDVWQQVLVDIRYGFVHTKTYDRRYERLKEVEAEIRSKYRTA